MKNLGIYLTSFLVVWSLLLACGGPKIPDYDSKEKDAELESSLVEAMKKRDSNAIAYWLSKNPDASLALCLLLRSSSRKFTTIEMSKFLVEKGANPNVICEHSYSSFTPLARAVGSERVGIVRFLLAQGANPNLVVKMPATDYHPTDYSTLSPLMLAVSSSDSWTVLNGYSIEESRSRSLEIARLLLDAGADVNYLGSEKTESALMIAAKQKNRNMVALLLSRGARKDLRNIDGDFAENYAARAGDIELARQLAP